MSHILVIVAQKYNGNELWPMLRTLQASNHSWDIAAFEQIIVDERSRKGYYTTKILDNITSMDGYDGLVFVSGNPQDTVAHWKDPKCNMLVVQAHERNLPLAAICAAVPSLGPAVKKVKVSSFPLNAVREELIEAGAIIEEVSLTTDRNIVTAENEVMTGMWADNFVCVLEGRPPKHELHLSPFKRPSHQLRTVVEIEFLKKRRSDD